MNTSELWNNISQMIDNIESLEDDQLYASPSREKQIIEELDELYIKCGHLEDEYRSLTGRHWFDDPPRPATL